VKQNRRQVNGPDTRQEKKRKAMLAKIHIALKGLGLEDHVYREVLEREFSQRSAARLTIAQLDTLLGIFRAWGWQSPRDKKVAALRYKARAIAARIENGEKRLKGLTKKICGADQLAWCHDPAKLERLLAALGKIERDYDRK